MTKSSQLKIRFIGVLSRFRKMDVEKKIDILALLSGPEPQRSVFENLLREQLKKSGLSYFMVNGKPQAKEPSVNDSEVNYLSSVPLNEALESATMVVCRPGYTTVMDLCRLGKKAIFVPTPGQTEQEYLASQLEKMGVAYFQNQNEFDLLPALEKSKKYKGFEGYPHSANLLADAVDTLLSAHA